MLTIFAGEGHGSGFIISKDGYVLTNHHVVGNVKQVSARTLTGRELVGEVIRSDRTRDVALVKLEEDQYQPLPLGDSSQTTPGSEVFAIGSPRAPAPSGAYGQSVTQGVVSGFRVENERRFIQSDVTVHPGNSGGPLLTKDGVVIGMAAEAVLSDGFGVGLNLFIPIEEAISTLGIESDHEDAKGEGS